jgi:pyrroloquinoline quinone biosynthesis protein D
MGAEKEDRTPKPATPGADARPVPVPGIPQRDLGSEYVFYDARGERVHVLNETARDVYLLCDGSRSIRDIARALTGTHDVDLDTALSDAQEVVGRMVRFGLLTLP